MTSRVSLLAAAALVCPWEPPCLPEAPPHPGPSVGSGPQGEGAGHRRACESAAGSYGDSGAGKQNRRRTCKEMKEMGMSCPWVG